MTPDERNLLTRFLNDLDGARGVPKDSEADALIRQAIASNPDAAYTLVQHAIVADQSLHAAQARIAELETQIRQPSNTQASFLPPSSGAGPWGQHGSPSYSSIPENYEPMPPLQRPGFLSAESGLGSFLRNAGTTAAGVAGGEMLFNGLSDMFGHRSGGLFGGGQSFADRPEEVVVNNYGDGSGDLDGFDNDDNW